MVMAGGNYSQMLKFAKCMRSNGVADFPDPSGNGTISVDGLNPQSSQFQGAAKVCRKLLPNGGQPSPAEQAAALAQALKLSQCMRAHGITDFPDPKTAPGGGMSMGLRFTPGSDLNPGSPLFDTAQKACHSNISRPCGVACRLAQLGPRWSRKPGTLALAPAQGTYWNSLSGVRSVAG